MEFHESTEFYIFNHKLNFVGGSLWKKTIFSGQPSNFSRGMLLATTFVEVVQVETRLAKRTSTLYDCDWDLSSYL